MQRKAGRPSFISRVERSLRPTLDAFVEADALSAADIYRELNLVRFGSLRAFRRYVAERRKEVWATRPHAAIQAAWREGLRRDARGGNENA